MSSGAGRQDERAQIRRLVRELGEAGGARVPTRDELHRLREFFARHVLREDVDAYILTKYRAHVEEDLQWPRDTPPQEYLRSLRETVLDPRSADYLTDTGPYREWSLYFVGQVHRGWRGPAGSNRIVVIFNGERLSFVTGFQPDDGDAYVERQDGFWVHRP